MRTSHQFFHDAAKIKHAMGKAYRKVGLISMACVCFAERKRLIALRKGL